MRRRVAVLLCVLAGSVLVGCGNERAKAPDLATPKEPGEIGRFAYPASQVQFSAPRNWAQRGDAAPRVAVLSSGRASVAIWRYPRREPLPETRAQLQEALAALGDAARGSDPRLAVQSSRLVTVRGVPGIELVAEQTIAGQRRRVRSTHLFARGAEYVVDASAPPEVFARVDRNVFAPLVASVQLGPVPRRRT